jgi:hypothetical protein
MDRDGKSLEQKIAGDEPSARGQTVLFYFTTRSATYHIIQGWVRRVAKILDTHRDRKREDEVRQLEKKGET